MLFLRKSLEEALAFQNNLLLHSGNEELNIIIV
jgi:hypothetical protein